MADKVINILDAAAKKREKTPRNREVQPLGEWNKAILTMADERKARDDADLQSARESLPKRKAEALEMGHEELVDTMIHWMASCHHDPRITALYQELGGAMRDEVIRRLG